MTARLIVDFGKLLYIGPVAAVAEHRSAGAVVAFGLDGDFEVSTRRERLQGRCIAMPPRVRRAVQAHGGRLGVLLLDPGIRVPAGALAPEAVLRHGERLAQGFDVQAWRGLLAGIGCAGAHAVDERVRVAAARLQASSWRQVASREVARGLGCSPARLERLFSAQMGTPMRSFRTWCRLRQVAQTMADGASLTEAAHAAGFFDSAHFGHAFKQSFGVVPSFVFRPDLQVHVVASALDASPDAGNDR